MLASHSVIRRYTPPTCTLEILAKSSPLSRWAGRTLLKDLRFKLSFDDPRIIQEKPITISGDREQLEILCDAVTDYVKDFLGQSVTQMPLASITEPEASHSGDRHTETDLAIETNAKETLPQNSESTSHRPYLQAQGLLSHQLHFGSLAPTTSEAKIELSATQLFDLANALDKYRVEIEALPNLNTGDRLSVIPIWAGAAAVLLVAVGLASTRLSLFSQQSAQTNSIASSSGENTGNNANLPDVLPPEPSQSPTTPSPKLPETLASAERLPPPPPVDRPKPPPPNIPDFSKYPVPSQSFILSQGSKQTVAISPDSSKKAIALPVPPPKPESSDNANNEPIQLPKLPALIPQSSNPSSEPENTTKTPAAGELASGSAKASDRLKLTAANYNPDPTLEKIPQLVEIKDYFQKRWKTPAGLTQTLEYRLMLNSNGSIKSIIPLGKTSEIYLDRTNIPLMGESFISPFPEQQSPIVRLVFDPDGTVKTFQE